MTTEYVHVGSHADILANGRSIGPGERVQSDELDKQDQHLVDGGVLVDAGGFDGPSNVEQVRDAQRRAGEEIAARQAQEAQQRRGATNTGGGDE